jgi:hypothetical protein
VSDHPPEILTHFIAVQERAEVERVKAINDDLKRARLQQKQSKLAGLAALARQEQEDFYRVIAAQREQEETERHQAAQQVRLHAGGGAR